jgi:hypothetical protein
MHTREVINGMTDRFIVVDSIGLFRVYYVGMNGSKIVPNHKVCSA